MKVELFVLIFAILFEQLFCACRQSFLTICDTVADAENIEDDSWTDVVVKSEAPNIAPMVNLDIYKFSRLNSLIIVGQINSMEDYQFNGCSVSITLSFLNLYDNELQTLKSFPHMTLSKLSLANNRIESIQPKAFESVEAKSIDLSDNSLKVIESGTFTSKLYKNATREISIRRNKLSLIEPYSFSPELEILRLDENRLAFLEDEVFENMTSLQALFINRNELSLIPNIKSLFNLKLMNISHNRIRRINSNSFSTAYPLMLLDLSHNNIGSVDRNAFSHAISLTNLEMSYNKLTTLDFLRPVLLSMRNTATYYNHRISVAFNRARMLSFELDTNVTFEKVTILLYGNPWWCKEWYNAEKYIEEIKLQRDECDLKFFATGIGPFCESYLGVPRYFPFPNATLQTVPLPSTTTATETEKFFAAAENCKRLINCELSGINKFEVHKITDPRLWPSFCSGPALYHELV